MQPDVGVDRMMPLGPHQQQATRRTLILGSDILHMTYDPDHGWVRKSNAKIQAIHKIRDRAIKQADDEKKEDVNFTVTEMQVDLWSVLMLAGLTIIIILFFVPNAIHSTYTALLLTYLYAGITYIMSNGILLHPQQSHSVTEVVHPVRRATKRAH